jgi:hypothetical protein
MKRKKRKVEDKTVLVIDDRMLFSAVVVFSSLLGAIILAGIAILMGGR